MTVYYNKLFMLMRNKHILQTDVVRNCNIGQSSFTRMRAGQTVTLDVLQRICSYLECDIGDIVSFKNPYAGTDINFLDKSKSEIIAVVFKYSVDKLMREKNYSIGVISRMSGSSLNTIKTVLAGTSVSLATYQKLLFNLGDDFIYIVSSYWAEYV